MTKKINLILLAFLFIFSYSKAQKTPTISMCDNYTCKVVDSFGCGNYKFKKECFLETIWNWGDGTPETTSKETYVMHKYCKSGKYLVTIRLTGSPTIIRYSFYVYPVVETELDFEYTILSQSDCDKSSVDFQGTAYCIESYDVNGNLIPGSDQLEWDFGDGTTSRDLNVKHTYTSGGDFVVTLKAISSPCELQKSYTIHLNDAVTCCLDNFPFQHLTWKPSGTQAYSNATISVKEELHLYPGDYLKLNNVRLEMGKDAKIVIERGAELDLNNSTVTTTSCGGYVWEGIEVWGGGESLPQDINYGINGNTGILKLNFSTIENADEAISVTKKIGLGFFELDKNYNGGYIIIMNSTFKNNYTSINMWPYRFCEETGFANYPCNNCSLYRNLSRIEKNTFISNAPMRDARYTMTTDEGLSFRLGISHFVYMNATFSVKFVDNDFKNLYFSPPVQYRGTGVRLIHSNIEIVQTVAVRGFRGLTVGVMTNADNSPCKTTKIVKNNFVNCQVAIDANSTKINILENVIYIPNTTAKVITQGIVTRNCKDFLINKNSINGLSAGKKYGILLRNNKTGTSIDNTLLGLYTGTQSELLNNDVKILCNSFQNQNYSIVVPNGKIGPQGYSNLSAGNTFWDDCKPASNNLNHIKSSIPFKYFFGGNFGGIPNCRSLIVDIYPASNNIPCNKINSNPCPPICTRDLYVQQISIANQLGNTNEVNALKSEMANELLGMEGGYDVYISYLESIANTDVEAAKILASTYFTEGKYTELQEKLDIIQQSESEEGNSFVSLFKLLNEAQQSDRDINDLKGEEVLQLNKLAQNDTTTAGYIAEGILYQIYGYEYNHNPYEMELEGRVAQVENATIDDIKLFPNPAKESLTISSEIEKIKEIKIYNVLGEMVLQMEVDSKVVLINTQTLPHGIYYSKVNLENEVISRKFIVE